MHRFLRVFIIFFTFSTGTSLFAQKVKYKDVYEMVKNKKWDNAYPLLKIITRSDTTNTSASLHLGNILYQKAMAYDVLKENKLARIFSDSALFYLLRAKRQLNEKEIRKNDNFYTVYAYNLKDTSKLITNRDTIFKRVATDLEQKVTQLPVFKSNITIIFNYYTKSVEAYNIAASIYKSLNSKYKTEKELCLLSNTQIENDLTKIETLFDSCIANFDHYLAAIKTYPIGYHQSYTIEPIETYRLDGLSVADFLAEKCKLWNYKKWALYIKEQINDDIKKIRESLIKYDDMYNTLFEKVKADEPIPDTALSIIPDKNFFSLLNKYDYQSVSLKLLDYKHNKWMFMGYFPHKLNGIELPTGANVDAKSQFLYDMCLKVVRCDSILKKLEKVDIKKEYPKYSFFFDKKFADAQGVSQYIASEKTFIQRNINFYKKKYVESMYGYYTKYFDSTVYISHANYQIPLFLSYESSRTSVKTTFIKEDKKGNLYVSGYISAGSDMAFIAKLNEQKQLIWFKSIPIKPENKAGNVGEFVSCVEPNDEGCVAAIALKTSNGVKTLMYKFDKSGNEVGYKKLETQLVVRQMVYDELNDQYLVMCKGETINPYQTTKEPVTIACYDNASTTKWLHKFTVQGICVEFTKIFEGYLAVFNYTSLSTGANTINSKAGEGITNSNVFLLKFSPNGQIARYETLPSENPLYALGTIRISNSHINVLCTESPFVPAWRLSAPVSTQRKSHIINSKLEILE